MTKLVRCYMCHEKKEPAVRDAIWCADCWPKIEAFMKAEEERHPDPFEGLVDPPKPVVVNVFARKDGSIYDD